MNASGSRSTRSLARLMAPSMPSASGVRITSAPRARMLLTFSSGRVFVRTLQGTEAGRKRQLSYQQVSIQQSVAGPLLPTAGRLLLAGVVAAAGAHCEPAIAAGTGVHVDGAVSSDSLRSARLITNCVLVANIVRNGTTNGIDFIRRFRQEGDSSGTLRHSL